MLSCDNDLYEDDEWYYYPADDFSIYNIKEPEKCCSCKAEINYGDTCVVFGRFTMTDESSLIDYVMCDNCGEVYLNLRSIGYSHYLNTDIRDYHELVGFKRR